MLQGQLDLSGTRNKGTSMKQGKQEWVKKTICEGQEDHGDMGTDINETGIWEQKMKQGETGMNGRVLEM